MREAVSHKAQFTAFDILFDRVERLFFGDFHLRIGPSRNFDDHVEDTIVPVCKERNIVEWRDDVAVMLDEHAVF